MKETILPPRLKEGDHIRIIAPSGPLSGVPPDFQKRAYERLVYNFGARISFGNIEDTNVEDRYQDLLHAFEDDAIDVVLPARGGFSANDILTYCYHNQDKGEKLWGAIRDNPKIFMGASDNSMLNNAVFSQTGLINYYGYHFWNIGAPTEDKDTRYIFRQLYSCLVQEDRYILQSSESWEDELWDLGDTIKYRRFENAGPKLLEKPSDYVHTIGRIAVGCVRNLSIMSGTPYQPRFNEYMRRLHAADKRESPEDVILFLEDTMTLSAEGLKRELAALTMMPGWEKVKALIFGRIPHDHKGAFGERKLKRLGEADDEGLTNMKNILLSLKHMNALANVAIIATSFDLGHTLPSAILPVGGWAQLVGYPDGRLRTEISHTPYTGSKNEAVRRA